jgi:hypothetical protein
MSGLVQQYHVQLSYGQRFGPADLTMIGQWAREGRVPVDALLVPSDGSPLRSVLSEPSLRAILHASAVAPPTLQGAIPAQDAPLSGMIPYKNPPALISYYLSLAGLLPFIGILFSIPAFILGIIGLRKRLRTPAVRGMAHAWIGIILGGLCTLGWAFVYVAILAAASRP